MQSLPPLQNETVFMMATENNSIAELIKEDVLTCPICLEIFEEPKTLPCFHTYCRDCLASLRLQVKLKRNLQLIRCPECRKLARLSKNGVDDFPTSFFINRTLEIYNTKRQLVTCNVCRSKRENRPAQNKCITCGDTLCEDCAKGHKQSSQTLNHSVITLSDFATGRYAEVRTEKRKFPCQDHSKELEYYCSTCEMVACLACVLVSHKDHDFKTVEQAFNERKDLIGDKLSQVKTKMLTLKEDKVRLAKMKTSVEAKVADITHSITETSKQIMQVVEKESRMRKTQLKLEGREKLTKLKSSMEIITNVLKNDPSGVPYLDTVLSTGEPVEILEFDTLLKYKLNLLAHVQENADPAAIELETKVKDLVISSRFQGPDLNIFTSDSSFADAADEVWSDAQETITTETVMSIAIQTDPEKVRFEMGDHAGIVVPYTGQQGKTCQAYIGGNLADVNKHLHCVMNGVFILYFIYVQMF